MSTSRGEGPADATTVQPAFDPALGYCVHPDLALRYEQFGALAYHYGNRRLTFLKSRQLTEVVEHLGEHRSALDALDALEVSAAQRPAMLRALARLQASEVISAR